jgi:SNF family Na+-dependent transporter
MGQHFVSHWRVWLLVVVVVVAANELVDRNFFDHREHVSGDVALAVVALAIAFFASYLVSRRRRRETA